MAGRFYRPRSGGLPARRRHFRRGRAPDVLPGAARWSRAGIITRFPPGTRAGPGGSGGPFGACRARFGPRPPPDSRLVIAWRYRRRPSRAGRESGKTRPSRPAGPARRRTEPLRVTRWACPAFVRVPRRGNLAPGQDVDRASLAVHQERGLDYDLPIEPPQLGSRTVHEICVRLVKQPVHRLASPAEASSTSASSAAPTRRSVANGTRPTRPSSIRLTVVLDVPARSATSTWRSRAWRRTARSARPNRSASTRG